MCVLKVFSTGILPSLLLMFPMYCLDFVDTWGSLVGGAALYLFDKTYQRRHRLCLSRFFGKRFFCVGSRSLGLQKLL